MSNLQIFKNEDSWDDTYLEKGYGWDKNPWVWVIEFERVRENDD